MAYMGAHGWNGSLCWPHKQRIKSQWPLRPLRFFCPWDFPSKNTVVGCHFLLQGIFSIQGLNPCLLHWWVDSLLLSNLESPRVLFCVGVWHIIAWKIHDFIPPCVCVCVCVYLSLYHFPPESPSSPHHPTPIGHQRPPGWPPCVF